MSRRYGVFSLVLWKHFTGEAKVIVLHWLVYRDDDIVAEALNMYCLQLSPILFLLLLYRFFFWAYLFQVLFSGFFCLANDLVTLTLPCSGRWVLCLWPRTGSSFWCSLWYPYSSSRLMFIGTSDCQLTSVLDSSAYVTMAVDSSIHSTAFLSFEEIPACLRCLASFFRFEIR